MFFSYLEFYKANRASFHLVISIDNFSTWPVSSKYNCLKKFILLSSIKSALCRQNRIWFPCILDILAIQDCIYCLGHLCRLPYTLESVGIRRYSLYYSFVCCLTFIRNMSVICNRLFISGSIK